MGILDVLVGEVEAVVEQVRFHLTADAPPTYAFSLPVVVLLHGYAVGSPSLRGIAHHLRGRRYNALCAGYSFWQDLSVSEQGIVDQIGCLEMKVCLVGHSQGGLIATAIGKKHPDLVDTAIAVGSPFNGTYSAYLNCAVPSVRQMIPGSPYLQELAERDFPEAVQFYSVYSPHDPMVIPWRSAQLPKRENVKNVVVKNVGHGGLIGRKCYGLVERLLGKEGTWKANF